MMMPSDAAIAGLCGATYRTDARITFDHFDDGLDDGVCWAIKHLPDVDVVVLRGSVTPQDWFRDALAITIPTRIGRVHAGFKLGMEYMWADLKPMLTQPVIVTGHSLGAARASILTALMIADDHAPVARVVFGEPKPGLLDHALFVASIPGRSYRNGDTLHHDLITDVPFSLPPEQYMHPTPVIPVCERPTGSLFERFGVFAFHHMVLYEAALAAATEKTA